MNNLFDNLKFINRLAFLIGGLAVFILVFSLVEYSMNNSFTVNKVIISGNLEHVDNQDLSDTAIKSVSGNLFTLNINEMQASFLQIPWVKHITVSREFPNDVLVLISEYTAIANLGNSQLISADGRIFNGIASESLPFFQVATENVSEALSDYQLIGKILQGRHVLVNRIFINGLGITKLFFSNNLQVIICGTDIEAQLKLLDNYWDKIYTINPSLNYINMCYKNALAINAINKPGKTALESSALGKGN